MSKILTDRRIARKDRRQADAGGPVDAAAPAPGAAPPGASIKERAAAQNAAAKAAATGEGARTSLIRVENLSKSFGNGLILDNVSLEIFAGEELSFVGTSGCGKTVLTKHFNGLLEPDAGRVVVGGIDLATATRDQLEDIRKQIGYVFQGNALFASAISATVYDNVSLPMRRDPYDTPAANESQIEARVATVLEEVGLGREYFQRTPPELSGGQKKRVAVARAIVSEPHIVIYDEPTTGLDPESTGLIIDLIDQLYRSNRNTTIAITHEKRLMRKLGRVIFLRQGRIYFDGPYQEFARSSDPVITSFLGD